MEYYVKNGKKYEKVYDTPRLYADGVWLVKNDGRSASLILKLGELTELYPFAQMMQSHEILSRWLRLKGIAEVFGSIEIAPKTLSYRYRSSSDMGKEILRFLSLPTRKQELEILDLENQTHVDDEGAVRDANGRLISSWWTTEALNAQIVQKEKELAELKKKLGTKKKTS